MNTIATIRSVASYVPEKVLTNHDLSLMVETSDEWITTRTGISERRIALSDEYPSTMGTQAAKKALAKAGIGAEELDLIIVCTMSPDFLTPSTGSLIQKNLCAVNAATFDIQAACAGFIYGLSIAKGFIESRMYQKILVISAEKNSSFVDYTDRNTCVLFGDGAGAAVVAAGGSGMRITQIDLGCDGTESDLISIQAGGSRNPATLQTIEEKQHYIQMKGKEVFKHAVLRMEESIEKCLKKAHLQNTDISFLVPHQANIRIIEALVKRFEIPKDKVVITIDKYANTSSSTIPIALAYLLENQTVHSGERLLLTAVGAGLSWGSALLQMHTS